MQPACSLLRIGLLLVCLLQLAAPGVRAAAAADNFADEADYWDEEEQPTTKQTPYKPTPVPEVRESVNATGQQPFRRRPLSAADYPLELLGLAVVVLYAFNIYTGSRDNKRIAINLAAATCFDEGILERNFSFIGPGGDSPALITKDSASCYQLYASGRRFCQALRATLDLIKRQDLAFRALQLLTPQDDELLVEVEMHEASMPAVVLLVATTKQARQLVKEEAGHAELAGLTRKLEVGKDRLPTWPSDKLTVLGEHSSHLHDLVPASVVDTVFGRAAFEEAQQWFRYMLITSEQDAKDKPKHALQFLFALPPGHSPALVNHMLGLVMVYIDLLGGYKLGPEQKKRSEKARQEWQAEKRRGADKAQERRDAEEERRQAKADQEQEKLRKMTPEARARYTERKRKLQEQRQMQKFVKKK